MTRDEAEGLLAYITENDHLKYQMEKPRRPGFEPLRIGDGALDARNPSQ